MKKLFLFLAMASTTMFVSCGSDDSDPTATKIVLTPSVATVPLGQTVTFTVKDDLGTDVTSTSTFQVEGATVTSPYKPTAPGSFTVTAKSGTFTSAPVTVNVALAGAAKSIYVNGQNYSLDNSLLAFYGGWAEDENATEATHGLFSMLVLNGDGTTQPTNYADVEFVVALDAEGALVFPDATNAEYLDIYEMIVNGQEVTFSSQQGGGITLEDFPDAINMPHAFSAYANYNQGSILEVSFDGNWLGFQDQSGRPAARMLSSASSVNKVMSRAEVNKLKAELKAQVLAKK